MSARTATSRLAVTFAGHATVLLELDGVRLLTDPLLRKRIGVLIRRSPVPPASLRRDLDAVLISHAHLDHLDVPSLRLIDRRTPVVAPRGVGALLRRLGFVPLEMDVGDEVEIGPASAGGAAGPARVRVRAVPADHAGTRYPLASEAPAPPLRSFDSGALARAGSALLAAALARLTGGRLEGEGGSIGKRG